MARRVVEGAEEGTGNCREGGAGRAGIDEVGRGAAKAFDGVLEELLLELLTTLLRQ